MVRKCKSRVRDNTQIFAVSLYDTNDPNRMTGKKQASATRLDTVPIKRITGFFSAISLNLFCAIQP